MFLVNAAQHPGPALFQGIGYLVIAIWMIASTYKPTSYDKEYGEKNGTKLPEKPVETFPAHVGKAKRKFWEYANDPGTRHNEDMKQEEKTNAR